MLSEKETVSRVAGLTVHRLRLCLDHGWVCASTGEKGLVFTEIDVARLQLICTLQDEMEVDEDLLPTLLSLLDQVYGLRRELRCAMKAISAQPEDIRSKIIMHMRKRS